MTHHCAYLAQTQRTQQPIEQAAMATTQDDTLETLMRTINDRIRDELLMMAERDAKNVEFITNYTLKVPIDNAFLQAGLLATKEYTDRERQTKNLKKDSDIPTNYGNYGSLANYVALEWMILCGKPETNKLFDETTRSHLNDILERITSPKDMKSIFLVAQAKMSMNKKQGIIHIRMNPKYRQLEAQLISEIMTN
jgi:hypothetical protein